MPTNYRDSAVSLLQGEDPILYRRKEKELLAHFKPTKKAEAAILRNIARHRWHVRRALRWQDDYLVRNNWVMGRDFNLLLRYQSQNDSTAHRLLKLFFALRRKAGTSKIGFVPQSAEEPATTSKIHPEVADRWEHVTAVRDPETGEYVLLKVLRDRERQRREAEPDDRKLG